MPATGRILLSLVMMTMFGGFSTPSTAPMLQTIAAKQTGENAPLAIWVYAEDRDRRITGLVDATFGEIRKRPDYVRATEKSSITLALSMNTALSKPYGPDAFSFDVRMLINGLPRDRWGGSCRDVADRRCITSMLDYAARRFAEIERDFPNRERLRNSVIDE